MSTPSSRRNSLIHYKSKEKKLPRKWHVSYAPPDKMEVVEMRENRPASRAVFASTNQSNSEEEYPSLPRRSLYRRHHGKSHAISDLQTNRIASDR
jgi:hypothetical protein